MDDALRTARASTVLKAELLANGVVPTPAFLQRYGPPYLEKRRAYGNPDDLAFRSHRIPQELYLPQGLICAVNVRAQSGWSLDWNDESGFHLASDQTKERHVVTFPERPSFYDTVMSDGDSVKSVVTLYGGGSLGIFVYGSCALVQMDKACGYCSIKPNRDHESEFAAIVTGGRLREALTLALLDLPPSVNQVMLNGGNLKDPDKSFRFYADLVRQTRDAIDRSGRSVDLHLIVFPPRDFALFDLFAGVDVSIAMNAEVYDPVLFERYCPGKHAVCGRDHILDALESAAHRLGKGRVYSIFVGGLEPVSSLAAGMERLSDAGVVPVVNVFHPDPGTPLEAVAAPAVGTILEMGSRLQDLYARHRVAHPFYLDCGRNSIDTEAYRGLFTEPEA